MAALLDALAERALPGGGTAVSRALARQRAFAALLDGLSVHTRLHGTPSSTHPARVTGGEAHSFESLALDVGSERRSAAARRVLEIGAQLRETLGADAADGLARLLGALRQPVSASMADQEAGVAAFVAAKALLQPPAAAAPTSNESWGLATAPQLSPGVSRVLFGPLPASGAGDPTLAAAAAALPVTPAPRGRAREIDGGAPHEATSWPEGADGGGGGVGDATLRLGAGKDDAVEEVVGVDAATPPLVVASAATSPPPPPPCFVATAGDPAGWGAAGWATGTGAGFSTGMSSLLFGSAGAGLLGAAGFAAISVAQLADEDGPAATAAAASGTVSTDRDAGDAAAVFMAVSVAVPPSFSPSDDSKLDAHAVAPQAPAAAMAAASPALAAPGSVAAQRGGATGTAGSSTGASGAAAAHWSFPGHSMKFAAQASTVASIAGTSGSGARVPQQSPAVMHSPVPPKSFMPAVAADAGDSDGSFSAAAVCRSMLACLQGLPSPVFVMEGQGADAAPPVLRVRVRLPPVPTSALYLPACTAVAAAGEAVCQLQRAADTLASAGSDGSRLGIADGGGDGSSDCLLVDAAVAAELRVYLRTALAHTMLQATRDLLPAGSTPSAASSATVHARAAGGASRSSRAVATPLTLHASVTAAWCTQVAAIVRALFRRNQSPTRGSRLLDALLQATAAARSVASSAAARASGSAAPLPGAAALQPPPLHVVLASLAAAASDAYAKAGSVLSPLAASALHVEQSKAFGTASMPMVIPVAFARALTTSVCAPSAHGTADAIAVAAPVVAHQSRTGPMLAAIHNVHADRSVAAGLHASVAAGHSSRAALAAIDPELTRGLVNAMQDRIDSGEDAVESPAAAIVSLTSFLGSVRQRTPGDSGSAHNARLSRLHAALADWCREQLDQRAAASTVGSVRREGGQPLHERMTVAAIDRLVAAHAHTQRAAVPGPDSGAAAASDGRAMADGDRGADDRPAVRSSPSSSRLERASASAAARSARAEQDAAAADALALVQASKRAELERLRLQAEDAAAARAAARAAHRREDAEYAATLRDTLSPRRADGTSLLHHADSVSGHHELYAAAREHILSRFGARLAALGVVMGDARTAGPDGAASHIPSSTALGSGGGSLAHVALEALATLGPAGRSQASTIAHEMGIQMPFNAPGADLLPDVESLGPRGAVMDGAVRSDLSGTASVGLVSALPSPADYPPELPSVAMPEGGSLSAAAIMAGAFPELSLALQRVRDADDNAVAGVDGGGVHPAAGAHADALDTPAGHRATQRSAAALAFALARQLQPPAQQPTTHVRVSQPAGGRSTMQQLLYPGDTSPLAVASVEKAAEGRDAAGWLAPSVSASANSDAAAAPMPSTPIRRAAAGAPGNVANPSALPRAVAPEGAHETRTEADPHAAASGSPRTHVVVSQPAGGRMTLQELLYPAAEHSARAPAEAAQPGSAHREAMHASSASPAHSTADGASAGSSTPRTHVVVSQPAGGVSTLQDLLYPASGGAPALNRRDAPVDDGSAAPAPRGRTYSAIVAERAAQRAADTAAFAALVAARTVPAADADDSARALSPAAESAESDLLSAATAADGLAAVAATGSAELPEPLPRAVGADTDGADAQLASSDGGAIATHAAASPPPAYTGAPGSGWIPTRTMQSDVIARICAPLLGEAAAIRRAHLASLLLRWDLLGHLAAMRSWLLLQEGLVPSLFVEKLVDVLAPLPAEVAAGTSGFYSAVIRLASSAASSKHPAAAAPGRGIGKSTALAATLKAAEQQSLVVRIADAAAFANDCWSSCVADARYSESLQDLAEEAREQLLQRLASNAAATSPAAAVSAARAPRPAAGTAETRSDAAVLPLAAVLMQSARRTSGTPFHVAALPCFSYTGVSTHTSASGRDGTSRDAISLDASSMWRGDALAFLRAQYHPAGALAPLVDGALDAAPLLATAGPSRSHPLSEVLSPLSMARYARIHGFQLQLKRVQYDLRRLWVAVGGEHRRIRRLRSAAVRRYASAARASAAGLDRAADAEAPARAALDAALSAIDAMERDVTVASAFRHEASVFVDALSKHVAAHVLDRSFRTLLHQIAYRCESVEDVRACHDAFTLQGLQACLLPDVGVDVDRASEPLAVAGRVINDTCTCILQACLTVHSAAPGHAEGAVWPAAVGAGVRAAFTKLRNNVQVLLRGIEAATRAAAGQGYAEELLAVLQPLGRRA